MEKTDLFLFRHKLLLCGSMMALLFLCQSIHSQPLYKRKGGDFWFCSTCYSVCDTLEYKDLRFIVDFRASFYPDWSKTNDEFSRQSLYRSDQMKKNSARPEFLSYEPEYMDLIVFIKDLDGKWMAHTDTDTLYMKDGKAHTKKTYRFLDAKSDAEDIYATVEFCVDFRHLEKNSAEITFSTNAKNRKKAKNCMFVAFYETHPKYRSRYFWQ